MQCFNYMKKCISCILGMLLVVKGAYGTGENSASILVPVTLINMLHTCSLSFSGAGLNSNGGVYQLGSLKIGEEKEHSSFNIIVDCKDTDGTESVNTALTASVRNPTVDNYHIQMTVNGQYNDNAPVLWLESNGKSIPVNGAPFCQGVKLNRNVCTLTPYTRVPLNSPGGEISAAIVFDITYI